MKERSYRSSKYKARTAQVGLGTCTTPLVATRRRSVKWNTHRELASHCAPRVARGRGRRGHTSPRRGSRWTCRQETERRLEIRLYVGVRIEPLSTITTKHKSALVPTAHAFALTQQSDAGDPRSQGSFAVPVTDRLQAKRDRTLRSDRFMLFHSRCRVPWGAKPSPPEML